MSEELAADDLTLPIKRTAGDTIEKRLTDNAYYNILPARYLRKDADGDVIEQQEDLFERVAKNIALAEAVYEAENQGVEISVTPDQLKPDHPRRDELAEEVFGKGISADDDGQTLLTEHNVNKFSYETIVPELPEDVRAHVEDTASAFQDQMENLGFMPNSPTLMNAGDELQQLSACFVDSPADDIDDIHQTAKEAAQVFQCLTEESTVMTEEKGVVSVADVEAGDRIAQRTASGFQYKPVGETHSYENAETRTVTLANGLSVRGTPNHRLMIDGEWTRLDEIQAGQEIHCALGWLREADRDVPELTTVASGAQWSENRTVENTEILELYQEGLSDYGIAERLDCGKSTVQRRRSHELELPPNGNGGRKPGSTWFDESTAHELYQNGHTDAEIADELDVHQATVGRFRAREQLTPNGTPVKTVQQPEELTAEVAELVGLWVGDGSWHQDGVRFHVGRESVADYIDQLSRTVFGTGTSTSFADGCYEVGISSHEIKRWWEANFDCKDDGAQSARVPQVIKRGPATVVEAFLRGYFTADGTLLDDTYPKLYSSSERAIDDVATLMMGLGYPVKKSVIRDEDAHPYYGLIPATGDGRKAFLREVGFIDERRETGLSNIESVSARDSYVIGEEYTVEVDSVVESAPTTVYDITVADNHEYVTDGIVSHNSGGGMGYAFWQLRPYGDAVGSTGGIASGPITFMRTFDQMCFPPGTKVLTPCGQRPIEALKKGDLVIDENGNEQPVVETMERDVDEELVEIVPERLNKSIRATGEHPFKIVRDDGMEWVDARDLSEDDLLVLGHSINENGLTLDETLDLSSVASGPLVFTDGGTVINRDYYNAEKGPQPAAIEMEVPVADFATVAGWYLAEGCVVYRRGLPNEVTFTLHADERDEAAEIEDALESFDAPTRVEVVDDQNTLHLHVESASFAQLIEGLFGTGNAQKRVPDFFWDAPVETQAQVVEALFDGDGTLETRGKSQRAQLKLTCEEVIDWVFQVGLRCGVQFSRHSRSPDNRQRTHWVSASVGTALGTPLECLFDDVQEDFRAVDRTKQAQGREVVAVGSVERVEYEGPVYNTEVADTHTYVAEDIVVHNCETIAQGGARRGAQMGVMRVSHPDVIQFIHAKNKDVSLAHTLRLNDPDDFTHNSFADALEEARELIDDDGRVPEHLRNAVEGHLSNFNISVGITDRFMETVENDEEYTFTNPRTGDPHIATEETKELYEMFDLGEYVEVGEVLSVPANLLWEHIIEGAHENGEPGVIYLERVNKKHSFDVEEHPDHRILTTNPCGEQPLEEYEACNLGHINLSTLAAEDAPDWRVWADRHADASDSEAEAISAFLDEAIDWAEFDRRIALGTRFLENVVTMSDFPVPEIEQKVREMRKIGLGIMGLAQLYVQLGIRYGSDPANKIAQQLMTHINHESKLTSHELAKQRGSFDEWEKSKFARPTEYREWFEHHTGEDADDWADGFPVRNHNSTTIAPTGCVEENSLVSTDQGIVPIKELDETTAEFEQWDEIEVGVSTDGGTKTATAVYDNGFADVRRIETDEGFDIAATPNHRFRTITADGDYAWKEADDFESGDHVVLQRNTFDDGSRATLDTSERDDYHWNSDESLELPAEMTPELAEFLGYFIGDGYVHEEVGVKLVVESDAEELDAYLRELGESLFGVTPTVEDRETRHILTFGGRHLSRYFVDNGWKKADGNEGEGAASAFIPDEVLAGTEEIVMAFLRGLFEADGTASQKIELTTVSATLADQVQTLLLSLGCVFVRDTLEMADRDDHYGDRPRNTVRGANKREDERFVEEIGFITKSTEFDLTPQSYKNDTYPPAVVDVLRDVDGYGSVSERVRKRVNQSPINGSVSRKLVRDVERETGETVRLDSRRLTDFYVATVDEVSEETAYTKDISVPANNTYIADGFVTHNTTSMVGNTTGGCEPIYNVAYYKNVSDDVQGDEMLVEFDDYFLRVLEENDIDVEAVKEEAQEQMANNEFDGVDGLETVPDAVGELFVTTGDLSAKEHAGVQVACQAGVDSAISKTVNAPNNSTVEDAAEVFEYIYENGGKGVTYYRDGTRSKQVLTTRAQNAEFADMDEGEIIEQIKEVFGGIEGFLEHEEVQAVLEDQTEQLLGDVEPEDGFAQKRTRPDVLHGVTQRIDTGYGKLYVNINEDPEADRPFELFANIGNSGGFTASFTEALAKTISTALRAGVDPEEIADELQGIRSPKVAWDKGEQIQSIPDAIGTAMRRYLDGDVERAYPQQQTLEETTSEESASERSADEIAGVDTETDGGEVATQTATDADQQSIIDAGESPECPECGSLSLYYSEGCKTCESCGWSEC